jgi:hypothetical protein
MHGAIPSFPIRLNGMVLSLARNTSSIKPRDKFYTRVHIHIYIKVKVKLPCAVTEHHAMKAYWGVEVKLHALFDLGTRWR